MAENKNARTSQGYAGVQRSSPNFAFHIGIIFNPGSYLLSHPRFEGSTIGGRGLNDRIRNGNGCDPSPMTTGKC